MSHFTFYFYHSASKMQIIVLSAPIPTEDEYDTMCWLFEHGLDRFHIRKPDASNSEVKDLINSIPQEFKVKSSIHFYHQGLTEIYTTCGLHHTSKSIFIPDFDGSQSKSFHSIEEIKSTTYKYDYGFLSPIFPSITKEGYVGDFDEKELMELNHTSSIPLYALGGISPVTVKKAKALGFAGVVLFGTIWEETKSLKIEDNYKKIVEIAKG